MPGRLGPQLDGGEPSETVSGAQRGSKSNVGAARGGVLDAELGLVETVELLSLKSLRLCTGGCTCVIYRTIGIERTRPAQHMTL